MAISDEKAALCYAGFMKVQDDIREAAAGVLRARGVENPVVQLSVPQEVAHGDYATSAALSYAKQCGVAPRVLAEEILAAVTSVAGVAKAEIAGPGYVNVTLENTIFGLVTEEVLQKNADWGRGEKKNARWLIEHTSPNPNKACDIVPEIVPAASG